MSLIRTLLLLALSVPAGILSAAPAWWTQPDTQIIQQGAAPSNLAVANTGQLKQVARQAKAYLDANLTGGAGTAINNLVASFKPQAGVTYTKAEKEAITRENYSAVNLGQLKAVATLFYDRLIAEGIDTRASLVANGYPSSWTLAYPWDPATPKATNYALATIGQLKLVFSFEVSPPPPTTPVISPAGGTFAAPVTVTIGTSAVGADIRYTLNGSTPTASSTLYTAPISIASTSTLKAVAIKAGVSSSVATAVFTITPMPPVLPPTISPNGGTFSGQTDVTLACETAGATIHYTVDGTAPNASSPAYTDVITLTSSCTLRAFATLTGYTDSTEASAIFTITSPPTVAAPTISPNGGTYLGHVSVTLATTTTGAEIRYTTNGADPSPTSALYSGPFDLTFSATLKAKAFKTGFLDSAIESAEFVIEADETGLSYPLGAFDYAIVTYSWGTTDGTDLDTRTAFTNVSPDVDNMDVGWARYSSVGALPYLNWSGDNTSTGGSETVTVDFKSAAIDYPPAPAQLFNLRLRSFWYNYPQSGNVVVRVKTYLSGAIDGFTVVGGTPVNDISVATHVAGPAIFANIDGNEVGKVDYDPVSKTGTFKLYTP